MNLVRHSLVALLVLAAWAGSPRAECEPADDDRVGDEIVVALVPSEPAGAVLARHGLSLLDSIPEWGLYLVGVVPGTDVDAMVGLLEADPDVLDAEPHRRLETAEGVQRSIADLDFAATTQDFVAQPAASQIRATIAHERHVGDGVTVAVLDTRFDLGHAVLRDRLAGPGFDLIGGQPTAGVGANGLDDDADGFVDESDQHGTHVAGLVLLAAPGARILPIRVLEEDGLGEAFVIAKGIALALREGAHVINLSFGMVPPSPPLSFAIERAQEAGVVVVAPAGNRGGECPDYPAAYSEVVSVVGVDGQMIKTSFSSYGSTVDLAAPAEAILSPYLARNFARWSGTSFAAPLVSGGVALLLDRYPGLLPTEVEGLLRANTQPDPNQNGPFAGKTGTGTLDLERITQSIAADRSSLKLQKRSSADPGSTWVRWSPVEGAGAYDLVRGTLSSLGRSGGAVHLGPVTCRADGVAAGVVGWVAEPDVPPTGEAFFYLIRDDADELGGMSYGTGSVGEPRLPTSGDCEL